MSLLDENDNAPKWLHKRGIHTIPEFNLELQSDQPTKAKKAEPPNNSEYDEDEEDLEASEDEDEEMKWSDWNVMQTTSGMFSEGGGWKKIFQVVAFDNDEGK